MPEPIKPHPFGLLTRVQWNLFHLGSCTEGDGSHQRKGIFRIAFFEGRILEAYFPRECVDSDGPAAMCTPGAGLACKQSMKPQVALL